MSLVKFYINSIFEKNGEKNSYENDIDNTSIQYLFKNICLKFSIGKYSRVEFQTIHPLHKITKIYIGGINKHCSKYQLFFFIFYVHMIETQFRILMRWYRSNSQVTLLLNLVSKIYFWKYYSINRISKPTQQQVHFHAKLTFPIYSSFSFET